MSVERIALFRWKPEPSFVRQFGSELVGRLMGWRPPAGLFIEIGSDGRPGLGGLHPPGLFSGMGSFGGRLSGLPAAPPFLPREAGAVLWGYLRPRPVADGSTGPERPGVSPSSDVVEVEPPVAPGAWVGLQTHWAWTEEGLFAARRFCVAARTPDELAPAVARWGPGIARRFSRLTGRDCLAEIPRQAPIARDGERRTTAHLPRTAFVRFPAERLAEAWAPPGPPIEAAPPVHRIAFGSSGSGKSTWLAGEAVARFRAGMGVAVIDLHGDLQEGIVSRLGPAELRRLWVVDPTDPASPGIDVMAPIPGAPPGAASRHLLAGLKRLTPDGAHLYWGFRLERILESFAALVEEKGGDLGDLLRLLTDPKFREAARLATHRPELARFLEELEPLVRKNPEFLWSATSRLSPLLLHPAMTRLLAPHGPSLPIDRHLTEGGILLARLPIAAHGPEIASFAGTLLLARIYYGLVARSARTPPAVLLLLDEAPLFAPTLLAEILAEGRKFGVRALVVTQYPERLAPEVQAAAAGAATGHLAFRTSAAAAASVGRWVGLDRSEAERWLPSLAVGQAIATDEALGRSPRAVQFPPPPEPAVRALPAVGLPAPPPVDELPPVAEERILLALLQAEEAREVVTERTLVERAGRLPGPGVAIPALADALRASLRRGWICPDGPGLRLSEAGARIVGLGAPTHAARETDEHRLLLMTAFRIFARKGYRIEIVRQGRFDTALPDARFDQLEFPRAAASPRAVAEAIDRARRGWAWRYFGGRDVHLEAEVSGALRADRIRHGIDKARAAQAAVLFLVGDATRARRVRRLLAEARCDRTEGRVWTLPMTALRALPARRPRAGSEDDDRPRVARGGPRRLDLSGGVPPDRQAQPPLPQLLQEPVAGRLQDRSFGQGPEPEADQIDPAAPQHPERERHGRPGALADLNVAQPRRARRPAVGPSDRLEHRPGGRPAQVVEDDGHTVLPQEIGPPLDARSRRARDREGPVEAGRIDRLRTPGRPEDRPGPEDLGDRSGEAPGGPRCPQDQYRLAGREPGPFGEREPGGETGVDEGGRLGRVDPRGDRPDPVGVGDRDLGQGPVRAPGAGHIHPPTVGPASHPVGADDHGEAPVARVVARRSQRTLEGFDRGGDHLDPDLPGSDLRLVELAPARNRSEPIQHRGLHPEPPRDA